VASAVEAACRALKEKIDAGDGWTLELRAPLAVERHNAPLSLLCGLAPSATALDLFRGLQGIGGAVLLGPLSNAAATGAFSYGSGAALNYDAAGRNANGNNAVYVLARFVF